MRAPASLLTLTAVALLPLLSAFAPACTNAASSAAPDSGTSSGSSGGSGSSSGGGGASGFYAPQGCAFGFNPQTTLPSGATGFTSLALDDDGAVSATNGVPTRVRLGLPGSVKKGSAGYADPSTMAAFTWETTEANHAAKVRFATTMSGVASGTVQTGYVWTVPASEGLGTGVNMHEVFVCGLTPATHYYYQVGGGPSGSEVWGTVQDFTTMPAQGSNVTIGVFGDARDIVGVWESVHERMKEQAPGLMVIPGDVVDLGTAESEYQQWLNGIWHDPNDASALLTLGQQYIIPINGNHENDSADSFANWAIPADSTDSYPETYTSFDVGPVHIVMIDDLYVSQESNGETNAVATAQTNWLKADLAAADADRANHPFIIALSHRGMFSTCYHAGDPDVLATRGVLAPIYDQFKVDLAINGHDHEYERSKPLHAGSTPSGAPVVGVGTTYVINAGAGADPYAINSSPQSYSSGVQVGYCGGGTACSQFPYIGIYGFIAATKTTLTMTVYGLKASSTSIADDTVIDTVTLQAQ